MNKKVREKKWLRTGRLANWPTIELKKKLTHMLLTDQLTNWLSEQKINSAP